MRLWYIKIPIDASKHYADLCLLAVICKMREARPEEQICQFVRWPCYSAKPKAAVLFGLAGGLSGWQGWSPVGLSALCCLCPQGWEAENVLGCQNRKRVYLGNIIGHIFSWGRMKNLPWRAYLNDTPPSIMAILCPSRKASSRSWLTKIILQPSFFWCSSSSACRWSWISRSRAEKALPQQNSPNRKDAYSLDRKAPPEFE